MGLPTGSMACRVRPSAHLALALSGHLTPNLTAAPIVRLRDLEQQSVNALFDDDARSRLCGLCPARPSRGI